MAPGFKRSVSRSDSRQEDVRTEVPARFTGLLTSNKHESSKGRVFFDRIAYQVRVFVRRYSLVVNKNSPNKALKE
ncbi:hypothetical protein L596_007964 [Steinernema carpocapsae]|uniref:Uncharacterized protein n=1 Tax=Steinernema carpocapsae TaxID=34508 RepID=A0A4U5PBB7_STECR|nr:hypothetical protein L596_007964 [Steinernema carpocapsae]